MEICSSGQLFKQPLVDDDCQHNFQALHLELKQMKKMVELLLPYREKAESTSLAAQHTSTGRNTPTSNAQLSSSDDVVDSTSLPTAVVDDHTFDQRLLLDRLHILEREKSDLVLENCKQRRRYERCLNDVTSHVVRVLMAQKALRNDCLRLQERVQQLEEQNRHLQLLVHQTFNTLTCSSLRVLNEAAALCGVHSSSLDPINQATDTWNSTKSTGSATLSSANSVASGSLLRKDSNSSEGSRSTVTASTARIVHLRHHHHQQQTSSVSPNASLADDFASNSMTNASFVGQSTSVERLEDFVDSRHVSEVAQFRFQRKRFPKIISDGSAPCSDDHINGGCECDSLPNIGCRSPVANPINASDSITHQIFVNGKVGQGGSKTLHQMHRRPPDTDSDSEDPNSVGDLTASRHAGVVRRLTGGRGTPSTTSLNDFLDGDGLNAEDTDLLSMESADDSGAARECSLDDSDYERLVVENIFDVNPNSEHLLSPVLPPQSSCQEKLYTNGVGFIVRPSRVLSLPLHNGHSTANRASMDTISENYSVPYESDSGESQSDGGDYTYLADNIGANSATVQARPTNESDGLESLQQRSSPVVQPSNSTNGLPINGPANGKEDCLAQWPVDTRWKKCTLPSTSIDQIAHNRPVLHSNGVNGKLTTNKKRQLLNGAFPHSGLRCRQNGRMLLSNNSLSSSTSSYDGSGSLDSRDWIGYRLSDDSHSVIGCGDRTFASVDDGYSTARSCQMAAGLGRRKLPTKSSKTFPFPCQLNLIQSSSEEVGAAADGNGIRSSPICPLRDKFCQESAVSHGLTNECFLPGSSLANDSGNSNATASDFDNNDVDCSDFRWQIPCRRCWSESHLLETAFLASDWPDCETTGLEECDKQIYGECQLLRRSLSDPCLLLSRNVQLHKNCRSMKVDKCRCSMDSSIADEITFRRAIEMFAFLDEPEQTTAAPL